MYIEFMLLNNKAKVVADILLKKPSFTSYMSTPGLLYDKNTKRRCIINISKENNYSSDDRYVVHSIVIKDGLLNGKKMHSLNYDEELKIKKVKISEKNIVDLVRESFDLTPAGIIEKLKLRRPIYRQTAAYGHFGRSEEGFTWEEINMADVLKKNAK